MPGPRRRIFHFFAGVAFRVFRSRRLGGGYPKSLHEKVPPWTFYLQEFEKVDVLVRAFSPVLLYIYIVYLLCKYDWKIVYFIDAMSPITRLNAGRKASTFSLFCRGLRFAVGALGGGGWGPPNPCARRCPSGRSACKNLKKSTFWSGHLARFYYIYYVNMIEKSYIL